MRRGRRGVQRRAAQVDPGVTRLAHAAEGRLHQGALLQSAESRGLEPFAIPKQSIWEQGESALGVAQDELRHWIDQLRREVGPPWAQDQKLASLAAWIALARSS